MFYIMMGIAAGLVWDRIDFEKGAGKESFGVFMIQLAKCFVVVSIFLHNPMLAGIEIILWLMILRPTHNSIKSIKLQGIYCCLIWPGSVFAMVLNISIWSQ
jgi:tryptophan-rich sensory protein